jgi:hypothetical protein
VAKKSKTEAEKKIAYTAESTSPADNGNRAVAPRKKPRSAADKPKLKKAAPRKTAAPVSRASSKKTSPPSPLREPTDDEIRIRAYFLAERRIQLSLPGDSAHDWIEARRQLIEESGPASS